MANLLSESPASHLSSMIHETPIHSTNLGMHKTHSMMDFSSPAVDHHTDNLVSKFTSPYKQQSSNSPDIRIRKQVDSSHLRSSSTGKHHLASEEINNHHSPVPPRSNNLLRKKKTQ